MAENQILPFAQGQGANVLSQADYAGDSMRLQGHQPGVARSALENKALRQATSMAAGLAQFIADGQADDVTDAKTPAEIAAMLGDAMGVPIANAFSANFAADGWFKTPQVGDKPPLFIQWGNATINVPAMQTVGRPLVLPVSFPNNAFAGFCTKTFADTALIAVAVHSVTKTQINFQVGSTHGADVTRNVFWIVIGN